MDVLRPEIIVIGDICYMKNPIKLPLGDRREQITAGDASILDQVLCDEVCDASTNIEETDKGLKIVMDVPSVFFKFIIGKKGETKKNLEAETRTLITIPKAGHDGPVVIIGHDRAGVLSAKTRIDILVNAARQRQPFSHFLSIPVLSPEIQEKFEIFKANVLEQCKGDRGLDSTVFQNPQKLHLTLGTMALANQTEIDQALQILQDCQETLVRPILQDRPLIGYFHGLEYMNDDPNEVDVLYAKVESEDKSDRFQLLVDRIVEKFISAGFMQQEYDHVKLHVTVMNTLFRKDPTGASVVYRSTQRKPAKDRESFDATNVLQKFGKFDFGSMPFSIVHLSQRYSTSSDGYYACAGSLQLP